MVTADLDDGFRAGWIETNLATIARNIREVERFVGSATAVMAVVKANAYGHGLARVAEESVKSGAAMLGVAIVNEAVMLRRNGIESPILVLGCALPEESPRIVSHDISQVVSNMDIVRALSREGEKQGKLMKVHAKIDTGMGRVGVPFQDAVRFVREVVRFPKIELEGLMTHFSAADRPNDLDYTHMQLNRFVSVIRELEKHGVSVRWKHAANSAGVLFVPESHLDLVRPGLLIYGISPIPNQFKIHIRPALSLHARITQVKGVEASEDISYGRTFTTKRKSRLGIVPLGYGDGFSRKHSNRGRVIVNGEYAPIVGSVCMDQFVVDLTDAAKADLGDEVVLIGRQNGLEISAWDLAKSMESIPYEVVSGLSARIPRRFINA